MRQLKTTDIFAFCRLVNAIGIKEEIRKIVMEADSLHDIHSNAEQVGFDLMFGIFEKAIQKKSEEKLFEFFSGLFEMETEAVKNMDPVDFIEGIMQIANMEKWRAFFSRAAALMK